MKKQKVCAVILIIALIFPLVAGAVDISSTGACVIDAQTGEIYFEKNSGVYMTPASMTKIMTLFVVFEEMEKGTLSEDTLIPISSNAARLSQGGMATNIPLTAGKSLSLRTLIDAMVIVSACASCTAVAEYISGSEDAFAELMNDVAAKYDIEAFFADSSGLSDNNMITPRGMAKLVKIFIERHPQIIGYTSKVSEYIDGRKYTSTNSLLEGNSSPYSGADGFKTGTTSKAGKCLASTALRNGSRIISVVFKAPSDYYRYADSKALLDEGFYRAENIGATTFSTDIKTYINEEAIPCYLVLGRIQALCVTAENLRFYGFEVNYDAQSETIYIENSPLKETSPVYEEEVTPGLPLHKTYRQPGLKAVLIKDGVQYPLETAISLNGQCAVSIDEIGAHFQKEWNEETRTIKIHR